jgi:aspartokinase
VTTSEIKISAVVDPTALSTLATALHSEFSLDRD